MGISLLSCCDPDPKRACEKIYDKITRYAEKLVKTGEDIEREFGIPIVNKRISVTPMALVAGASETEDCVPFALALDRAAQTCGVNFIGGYSALAASSRIPLPPRRTGMAWAAPSWWCSAMPWRTTPLWPALSTAWERRRRSSTWASPAPAWCVLL